MLDLVRSNSILTSRASAQAVQIAEGLRFATLQEVLDQMRTSHLPEDVTQHFVDLLTARAEGALRSAADTLASEALALGRLDEATVFKDDIETATYTALLDENTCDPCADADGTETEFGSAEYERLKPPYQDCEGGNRCRCQFVFTLKTEAPGGPIPITPLLPRAPYRPTPPRGPFPPPIGAPRALPSRPAPVVAPPPVLTPLPATGTPIEYATVLRARAAATEPGVSAHLRDIAARTGGDLSGFEFRLKEIDSLERKITADVRDLVAAKVEPEIRDALRYTTIYKRPTYAASVRAATAEMEARGYVLVRQTNYWNASGRGYQGVNTAWRAPNGQLFEAQFHTPETIYVKEKFSHPLFAKQRVETDPVKWQEYGRQIDEAWSKVAVPPGALDLPGRPLPAPLAPKAALPVHVRDPLTTWEAAHRSDPTETAFGVDARGEMVLDVSQGDVRKVVFTKEETSRLSGAVLTHNHPGGRAFSIEDFAYLRRADMHEIRIARRGGITMSARLTDRSRGMDPVTFGNELRRADADVQTAMRARLATGEITVAQAEALHHDRLADMLEQRGLVVIGREAI